MKVKIKIRLVYLLIIPGAIASLVPFIWMVSTSFKEVWQIFRFPPEWIPDPWILTNYITVIVKLPFLTFLSNTVIVSVLTALGNVVFSSMAAYAFARLEFPHREVIFYLYLFTMMIPFQVLVVPLYALMSTFGWVNTLKALWVPWVFGVPFSTFLLRQFFLTLPRELEDAAKIDGAGYLRTYGQIILPLSKTALSVVFILIFVFGWNDFFWPLVVTNTNSKKVLTVGLVSLTQTWGGTTDWGVMMAGATLTLIPILIIFAIGQRYFVQGIVLSGLKG